MVEPALKNAAKPCVDAEASLVPSALRTHTVAFPRKVVVAAALTNRRATLLFLLLTTILLSDLAPSVACSPTSESDSCQRERGSRVRTLCALVVLLASTSELRATPQASARPYTKLHTHTHYYIISPPT